MTRRDWWLGNNILDVVVLCLVLVAVLVSVFAWWRTHRTSTDGEFVRVVLFEGMRDTDLRPMATAIRITVEDSGPHKECGRAGSIRLIGGGVEEAKRPGVLVPAGIVRKDDRALDVASCASPVRLRRHRSTLLDEERIACNRPYVERRGFASIRDLKTDSELVARLRLSVIPLSVTGCSRLQHIARNTQPWTLVSLEREAFQGQLISNSLVRREHLLPCKIELSELDRQLVFGSAGSGHSGLGPVSGFFQAGFDQLIALIGEVGLKASGESQPDIENKEPTDPSPQLPYGWWFVLRAIGLITMCAGLWLGYRAGYWFEAGHTLWFIAAMIAMLLLVFLGFQALSWRRHGTSDEGISSIRPHDETATRGTTVYARTTHDRIPRASREKSQETRAEVKSLVTSVLAHGAIAPSRLCWPSVAECSDQVLISVRRR